MSKQHAVQSNPWNTISARWRFHYSDLLNDALAANNEKYNNAVLHFLKKVESGIQERIPGNLSKLATVYARFSPHVFRDESARASDCSLRDDVDSVILNGVQETNEEAIWNGEFVDHALELYQDWMENSPVPVPEFRTFVEGIKAVADRVANDFRLGIRDLSRLLATPDNPKIIWLDLYTVIVEKILVRLEDNLKQPFSAN